MKNFIGCVLLLSIFQLAALGCKKAPSATTGGQPPQNPEPVLTNEQKIDTAKTRVRAIAQAMQQYINKHKDVPAMLDLLTRPDADGKVLLEGGEDAFVDPWGKEYEIQISQSGKEGFRVTVSTNAPDGLRIESSTE